MSDQRTGASESITAEQLRHEIDQGRTGDKVAWPDPAAAPLGTDDEAAGTSPTDDRIREAYRSETGRSSRSSQGTKRGAAPVLVAIAVVACGMVALLIAAI